MFLSYSRNFGEPGSPRFNYFAYCAGVFETEVDVLTGEYQIRRVDIMYDCGERSVVLTATGEGQPQRAWGTGVQWSVVFVHLVSDGTGLSSDGRHCL